MRSEGTAYDLHGAQVSGADGQVSTFGGPSFRGRELRPGPCGTARATFSSGPGQRRRISGDRVFGARMAADG